MKSKQKTGKRQATKTSWKKGKSGNIKGGPKKTPEQKALVDIEKWRVKKIGWQVGFWALFGGTFWLLLEYIDVLGGIPL